MTIRKKLHRSEEEKKEEASLLWREISLSSDVIGIYGVDNPFIYLYAKDWLLEKENRYLFFVEDRELPWNELLATSVCSCIESDPRVKLFFIESPMKQVAVAQEIVEFFFGLTISWSPSFSYKESEQFFSFLSVFNTLNKAHGYILQEDEKEIHAQNLYHNLMQTDSFVDASRFSHLFTDVPAIICGASPSLAHHFSFLREVQHSSLIFVGGSAMGSFSRNGIPFHMGASVDPEAPLDRFMQISSFEVPFSYQNLMAKDNLYKVHAPKIWGGPSGSYPLENKVYQELSFSTPPIPWCTVSSYLLNQALLWGCNPIIFVGMDYCFSEDRYVKGVSGGEEKERAHKLIKVQNEAGEEVFTQEDWLVDVRYIEKRIQEHPHRKFFRLGKEGLPIQGAKFLPQEEYHRYVGRQKDLVSLLHQMLQKNVTFMDHEKVKEVFSMLEGSRQICYSYMEELIQFPEKLKEKLPLLEKEVFYQNCLHFPWNLRKKMFAREVRAQGLPWELSISSLEIWFYMERIKKHSNTFKEVLYEGISV
jgi:hypothetical protein